ncbi:MAG: hypothetical protein K6T75_02495 [Acetobacteraceae bacterium]|nr:hypothetical protein [Acetobacteraceae bacterium]
MGAGSGESGPRGGPWASGSGTALARILAALNRPVGERTVVELAEAELNDLANLGLWLASTRSRFAPRRVEIRLRPGAVEGRAFLELPRWLRSVPLRGRAVSVGFCADVGLAADRLELRLGRVSLGGVPLPVRLGLGAARLARLPPWLALDPGRRTLALRLGGIRLPALGRRALEGLLVEEGKVTVVLGPAAPIQDGPCGAGERRG